MKTRQRQAGLSIPAILIIAIMVGFFVMCGIRMAPKYFEYLSVREIVGKVAEQHDPQTETIADIRRCLSNLFNTNQIYDLQPKDVEVYRKDGKTYIDASYQVEVPVAGPIYALMKWDDLLFIAGESKLK
jgi:hypothetical protein